MVVWMLQRRLLIQVLKFAAIAILFPTKGIREQRAGNWSLIAYTTVPRSSKFSYNYRYSNQSEPFFSTSLLWKCHGNVSSLTFQHVAEMLQHVAELKKECPEEGKYLPPGYSLCGCYKRLRLVASNTVKPVYKNLLDDLQPTSWNLADESPT